MIILKNKIASISEILPAMKHLASSSEDLCQLRGPSEFLVIESHTNEIHRVRDGKFTASITEVDPRIHKKWVIPSHEMKALGELLLPGCYNLNILSNIDGVERFEYKSIFGEIVFSYGMLHFPRIVIPAEFVKILQKVDKLFPI